MGSIATLNVGSPIGPMIRLGSVRTKHVGSPTVAQRPLPQSPIDSAMTMATAALAAYEGSGSAKVCKVLDEAGAALQRSSTSTLLGRLGSGAVIGKTSGGIKPPESGCFGGAASRCLPLAWASIV